MLMRMGGGCGRVCRDGKRFVRLDEEISLKEDNMALATDIGERLMNMGGRELVDEAVKFFGDR